MKKWDIEWDGEGGYRMGWRSRIHGGMEKRDPGWDGKWDAEWGEGIGSRMGCRMQWGCRIGWKREIQDGMEE